MQIFHPLAPIMRSLGNRKSDPFQGEAERNLNLATEQCRQKSCLIKTAFAFTGGMEGDGNDQVEAPITQPWIIHVITKPSSKRMTEITLMSVLKFVHQLANEPAASIHRDRGVEMQNPMFAIGATKRLGDRP